MKEQLMEFAVASLKIVLPILVALLGLVAKRVSDLIAAKVTNEKIRGILSRLDQITYTAVNEVEQAYVSNLPDNATVAEMAKAKSAAIESARAHLGPRGLAEIKAVLGLDENGDMDKLLGSYVESRVREMKLSTDVMKKEIN